jgi:hypothetical protein
MRKPPFRRAIEPLIKAGLLEKAGDPLGKFLVFCEKLYLENLALRVALRDAGSTAFEMPETTPGMPGPHRKVFDRWYLEIAQDQLKRYSFLAAKASPKNPWN